MLRNISLRNRLLLIVASINILAVILLTIMANQSTKALKSGKEAQVRAATDSLIDKIDRNLFERYGDVQAFALSEPARAGNSNRIVDFMSDMMAAYAPIYDLMIVTNARGKVVAVNSVDKNGKAIDTAFLVGKDYSGESWFKAAISNEIKEGNSFVEDLHVDADVAKIFNSTGRVMNFTAPIRDKATKAILGVWTNRMSWADVVEGIVKDEATKVKSDRIEMVMPYLIDAKGIFMYHPQGAEYELKKMRDDFESQKATSAAALVRHINLQSPSFTGEVIDTMAVSKGYATYPSRGWFAIMQVPNSDAQVTGNWRLIIIATGLMALAFGLGFLVTSNITGTFDNVATRLRAEADKVEAIATQVNGASQNLSSASVEQAASLQETASAIEEMNAMVKKSSENANKSTEVANTSHEVATRGQQSVNQMMHAIEDIDKSNASIMHQVEQSNLEFSEIVKVISEIGNKTKVINDIVFQTKLLSFNASVEAARAGEHGKGFAVVAEEVGNLAQMSGNAAKEISDMLNSSIKRVESIVQETKIKVERLIQEGKEKVHSGTIVAKQCGDILDEVVRNVSEVNQMVGEISTAAQEQSLGISEITKAMNQMDQSTHENATTSQETAAASDQLKIQSHKLLNSIIAFEDIVHGLGHAQNSEAKTKSEFNSRSHESAYSAKPSTKVVPIRSIQKSGSEKTVIAATSAPMPTGAPVTTVPSENDPRFREI